MNEPLGCTACGEVALFRVGGRGYCRKHKGMAVQAASRQNLTYRARVGGLLRLSPAKWVRNPG